MNQLTTIDDRSVVPISEMIRQASAIQEMLGAVMKKGTHYDIIPGTKNNTLLKAGAEKIMSLFRLGIEPQIEDLSTKDSIRYRVTLKGFYIPTGNVVGFGLGECSSDEEKYKWRAAVCDEEFEAASPDRKRVKWSQGWGEQRGQRVTKSVNQVRTEHADLANTVLKMAKKRAMTDLCLTATAASDIFTQDLEDLDETLRDHLTRGGVEPEAGESKPKGKTLPDYPGERMAKNKASWSASFADGSETAEAVIAELQQSFTLSQVQVDVIKGLMPKEQA